MSRIIVGLTGRAGCGKSTLAALLEKEQGFERIRFADPLKAMLRAYYASCGRKATTDRRIEGDLKEKPDPFLFGRTPRHAMQTLGTEWGRGAIHPDIWVGAWGLRTFNCAGSIVAEDCRFENEAEGLRDRGGVIVRITRPSADSQPGTHASESGGVVADIVLSNDGTPKELLDKFNAAMARYS